MTNLLKRVTESGRLDCSRKREYIQAMETVSQQLAGAFKWNSELSPDDAHIPPYLRNFHVVFSKDLFDELPQSKPWNHTIELLTDAAPRTCKVYPLSASKQKELDMFLKENLDSGRI
jgi:hypothetical protein